MRISDWSSDVCSSDLDRLTLELTEQAMLSDPASAADQLAQIRALGVAVAIDDFGTGYSSLSLLARLPIDYLKIDSGFTRTIRSEEHTSELQSLMRISYAVFCWKKKKLDYTQR